MKVTFELATRLHDSLPTEAAASTILDRITLRSTSKVHIYTLLQMV